MYNIKRYGTTFLFMILGLGISSFPLANNETQDNHQNYAPYITQVFGEYINKIPLVPGDDAVRGCWETTRIKYTLLNTREQHTINAMKRELCQCKTQYGLTNRLNRDIYTPHPEIACNS